MIGVFLLMLLPNCETNGLEKSIDGTHKSNRDKLEVLLLGTFHFANFRKVNNGDVLTVKYRDILNENDQNDLELIADKIKAFNPKKIFIEYPYNLQNRLDSIYSSFSTYDYSKEKREEIIQLAFRVAKKIKHKK